MERARLRFDGFFGDRVSCVAGGGDYVRGPSVPFWAVGGGSAYEVGIILNPQRWRRQEVVGKASFREVIMALLLAGPPLSHENRGGSLLPTSRLLGTGATKARREEV